MLYCNRRIVLLALGDPYVDTEFRAGMNNYLHANQPSYDPYPDRPNNVPYPSQYASGQPGTLGTHDVYYSAGHPASEEFGVDAAAEIPVGGARPRVRQKCGSDNVKHRRTRSGCLTCRLRRVKVNADCETLTASVDAYCC